jgi:hypothetical protein
VDVHCWGQIFTEPEEEVSEEKSIEVELTQPLDAEEVQFSATETVEKKTLPVQVLTKADHGAEIFRAAHEHTQAHMKGRVIEQFPTEFWTELGIALE